MIYLFLSILLNAYLGIAFVVLNKLKIDLFQCIVYNYWTCVITGSFFLGYFPLSINTLSSPWFLWAIMMGALFISVFNIIAISSVKAGVTVTQTANKLSMVIPVLFSFFLYREPISYLKMFGILIALLAVVFITYKKQDENLQTSATQWLLPIILFISSGIIDTLTKYVERNFLITNNIANSYLIAGFFVAASFGTIYLVYTFIVGKRTFQWKYLLSGIILGIPNYFSIYFLVKALQHKGLNSCATIPINNIGVVFLVSLVGIFFFKEKLTKLNYLGLILSILSILVIYLGDRA
ncbi:MAG: hypothetical protein R2831_09070 [Chitinophagaceae bacterium]